MISIIRLTIVFFILTPISEAQGQTLPKGDLVNARSYLESLIVKKYTQQLATRVVKGQYQVSANLLVDKVKPKKIENKTVSDLDLSYLNPEELYKSYSGEDEFTKSYWEDYVIKKVEVSLGLKSDLGEATTKEVTEWFEKRVKDEFGSIGKSSVNTIKLPETMALPPKKNLYQQLKELQGLAGQIILALALLIGIILWKIMSGSESKGKNSDINLNNNMELKSGGAGGGMDSGQLETTDKSADEEGMVEHIHRLKEQINEVAPQVSYELTDIIKEWCKEGKQGILQVTSLAEAAGKVLGKLPIPEEFRAEVSDTFKSMRNLDTSERLESYRRVYWDLLATLNLGSDTLHRPFSFVSGVPSGTVSEVLLNNNAKMNAIVTLFMTDGQRRDYLETIDTEKKMELLHTAAELSSISEKELLKLENELAPNFAVEETERSVSLAMTLDKIINSLSSVEACTTLNRIKGPMMTEYKQEHASLAFLDEWPDDSLLTLYKVASTDEILNFLQIRPDLQERSLELVPPMTKAILQDDLNKESTAGDMEKGILLDSLLDKVKDLVVKGEIDLKSIFKEELKAVDNEQAA